MKDWGFYEVTKVEHHFVIIQIEDCKMKWKAYSKSNNIIDSFQLLSSCVVK